jgi:hypothetical protein
LCASAQRSMGRTAEPQHQAESAHRHADRQDGEDGRLRHPPAARAQRLPHAGPAPRRHRHQQPASQTTPTRHRGAATRPARRPGSAAPRQRMDRRRQRHQRHQDRAEQHEGPRERQRRNSLPSAPVIVNTGRNPTTVVAMAVSMADPTSRLRRGTPPRAGARRAPPRPGACHVFRQDDPHVHDGADGDGDAAQRHQVAVHPERLHEEEADQHRQRQHQADQRRRRRCITSSRMTTTVTSTCWTRAVFSVFSVSPISPLRS